MKKMNPDLFTIIESFAKHIGNDNELVTSIIISGET
jgi:ABC-type Zn uptake system ZnuABC Zn-binding protein ZnuA